MLTYHLVLVIKYRRKVINEDIFDSLMVIFDNIGF
ncbi:MAG: IS200/IS605 family transposase, partial [Methanobrevibacter sp.]|nr:IS200/IS605 family transposase [Methanobrevibacter sp.]